MFIYSWYTPYLSGLQVSWTSATSLTVLPGSVTADATSPDGQGFQLIQVGVDPLLDCTKSGANGVQGGSLAASTKYDVYAIGDTTLRNPGAVYAVSESATVSLPTGYNTKRRIFTFVTDGSANILKGYQTGSGFDRTWIFDAPPSALSAGAATSYTAISLNNWLPAKSRMTQVIVQGNFTPNTAGDIATFSEGTSTATNGQAQIAGNVTTKPAIAVLSNLVTDVNNNIQYKVTSASDSLGVTLVGYVDQLLSSS